MLSKERRARIALVICVLVPALGCARSASAQSSAAESVTPLALAGDAQRGARLAVTCEGCHGIPGYRNAYPSYRVPKLGGQNADYLDVALQRYRNGSRAHMTMQAQAASLTDQDIADLVAHLTSLDGDAETGIAAPDEARIAAGQAKAAACGACHGETGEALAPMWPHLAGQHASYLEQALLQYQGGGRSEAVMAPLAASLTEDDILDLATFYSAQRGLHTTVP